MPTGGASSGGSAGAVRAGAAYVEAFLKDNKLIRGLDGVRRRLLAFSAVMMGMAKTNAIGAGLIIAPLAIGIKTLLNFTRAIQDMHERTGASVEELSLLKYVAEHEALTLEELEASVRRFHKSLMDIEDTKAFDRLGLDAEKLKEMSLTDQLLTITSAFEGIENHAERTALAMDIFGKSGSKLLPFFLQGRQGIEDLMVQGRRLGHVMSKEDVAAADLLYDSIFDLKKQIQLLFIGVGSALVPALQLLSEVFSGSLSSAQAFMRENKAIVLVLGLLAVSLFAAAAASFLLGIAMKGLALFVGIASVAFKLLGFVIGMILSPIALVVAAIGGLGYLFLNQTVAGRKFADNISQNFRNIAETAKNAWGGITAAIQKGDMELAAQIALTTLRLAWAETLLWLTERWVGFKKMFRDGWADLGTGIRLVWNDLTSALAKGLAWVLDKALFLFRNTIGLLFDGLAWAAKKLGADDTAKTMKEIANLKFDSPEVQAGIEADRIRERDRIVNEAAAAQRDRDEFRQQQIAEAMKDVNAARDELERLVNEAKKLPAPAPGAPVSKGKPLIELDKLADATKGLFQSPNWKQSFSIGDKVNEKQLKAAVEGNKKLDKIAVALLNVGIFRIK